MKIVDSVYGPVEMTEPVLLALLETAAVKRLKGVMQHGITGMLGITTPITRFDHSVGAMLLVQRLGGSVKEQIAALLHDVSHTAFSHVIDYVFDDHDGQSYHDEVKETFLAQTDLPAVLAQYGYDWTQFLDESRFPLLEQPSPRLCADRIDYFLRDCQGLGLATNDEITAALSDLQVVNGRIVTKTIAAARWLAETYLQADDASWANFREVGLYEVTAQAIRRGLEAGAISKTDFWLMDKPFWQKLHAYKDAELQARLQLVSAQTQFVWDEDSPTFWVSTKLRSIDPDVAVEGALRPLSSLDTKFAQMRQNYLDRKQGKWPMRVIPPPFDIVP